MKKAIILPAILFIISALSIDVQSQSLQNLIVYEPEAERQFVEAMKFFKAGRFDTASVLFFYVIKDYSRSHRITGAYIMGAKAFYELKDYQVSIRFLKNLIDKYPQSTYIDDAHYTLALDYFRTGHYKDAASECIVVLQTSYNIHLTTRSEKLVEALTSSYLTLPELHILQTDAKSDDMIALVTVRTAEKLLLIGDVTTAREMLQKIAILPPKIKYVNEAITLLGQIENNGGMKIGVVLPLMLKVETPSTRALGLEFLEGIQLAVEEYNQKAPMKVSLEVRDTERDPSVAARVAADLCTDEKISAIIGPISSSEVFACAGIANERGIPLITPTATANGIAAIGPFIFQANPDYDTRGRDVAAFAYNALGARNFAVLAPTDIVGKQMAESFIDEVDSLGGEMVDKQFYTSSSMDLRIELASMRRKALERLEVPTIDFGAKMRQSELNKFIKWGVNQHLLDSLIERELIAPVTLLFGKRGKQIADSLKISTHLEHMPYDSLELPVTTIDAMFVPIASSEEIPVISSQLRYFNIQAQVIGTGDWNDVALLDQNRQYTDGVMFCADSYPASESETYRTFEANYKLANNNKTPGTNVMYGYDVAKIILQTVSQGNSRRKDLAGALAKVEGFEGLHSQISLSKNRVNTCLSVLQYKERQIIHIGKIDLARLGK